MNRIDFNAINSPERIAWRLQLADETTNWLARKIQETIFGGQPADVIAVLIAATSDACATVCVTEPDYEAAAKLFAEGMFLRIMATRRKAEAGVTAAYTLRPPKPTH